jgi:hypothetical protein
MPLRGTLSTMSVPELLMWISQHQKTGTLEIRTGELTQKLAFENGILTFSSSSNRSHTLGRILIERGVVTEAMHKQARDLRKRNSIAVAKALCELQVLTEEDVIRFLRKKAEKELFDLFNCHDGEFSFDEREMPDLDLLPLRVDVSKMLLRITQQMDEKGQYDFDATGIRLEIPTDI